MGRGERRISRRGKGLRHVLFAARGILVEHRAHPSAERRLPAEGRRAFDRRRRCDWGGDGRGFRHERICQRQPEACEVGGQAAVALGQRAQAGARLLFDVIQDKMAPPQTGSVKGKLPNSQDTLTQSERQMEWRTPLPPRDPRRPA